MELPVPLPPRSGLRRRDPSVDASDQHGELSPPLDGAAGGPRLVEVLRETCRRGGWTYAEVWVPAPETGTLDLHPLWHGDANSGRHFRGPTERLAFVPGTGLPGRAWHERCTIFVPDLADDPYFARPTAARRAGLRSGAAVPVLDDGEVTMVLAFFGRGGPSRQAAMQESVTSLAERLGVGVPARSAHS
jgi:GAF domain-containing protein